MNNIESRNETLDLKRPSTSRPNVFMFTEYKLYLKEMISYMKHENPRMSYRYLAREAGISSGYLTIIFNSAQEMAPKTIDKISEPLGLSTSELSYLHTLREISSPKKREQEFDIISRLKKFHRFRTERPDESTMINYLGAWYRIAIREMANDPEFRLDASWIRERLQFSVHLSEIEKSIEFLVEKGFLIKKSGRRAEVSKSHIECDDRIFRVALASLYRQLFNLASDAIDTIPREERNVVGHTMSLDDRGVSKANQILKEAIDKIAELKVEETGSRRVYNFGVNVIPLTRKKK